MRSWTHRIASRVWVFALLLGLAAAPGEAQRLGYARYAGDIRQLNLDPLSQTVDVSLLPLDLPGHTNGMALSPDGVLFLTNQTAGVDSLVAMHLKTGQIQILGELTLPSVGDMTFDSEGRLWVLSEGSLFEVDPATAIAQPISTDTTQLLALSHHGGQLFAIDSTVAPPDPGYELITIDTVAGVSSPVTELQGFVDEDCFNTWPSAMDFDAHGGLWIVVLEWIGGGCILPFPATSYAYYAEPATGSVSQTMRRAGDELGFVTGLAIRHELRVVEVPTLGPMGLLTLILGVAIFATRQVRIGAPTQTSTAPSRVPSGEGSDERL